MGSHVADELVLRGYKVVSFDLKPYAYSSAVESITGDIRDKDSVLKAVKGAEYVYNFSGLADLDSASTMAAETAQVNIIGNINILEACHRHKVKKFLFASTIYVYSEKGGFYRCSKQACEIYIEEFRRKYGVNYTILRYGSLYGPRSTEANIIYLLIKEALTKKRITYQGSGQEVREYINVRDAARLSVDMLDKKYDNKYMIITGHNTLKVENMLEMLKEMMGNNIVIEKNDKDADDAHYTMTPYSFQPKIGQKIVSNEYMDFGQGLLECINEIYQELYHEKCRVG